jgi:hypothetical protein
LWAGEIDEPGTKEDAVGVLKIEEAQQAGGNEESTADVQLETCGRAHANREQEEGLHGQFAGSDAFMHSYRTQSIKYLNESTSFLYSTFDFCA